MSTEHKPHQELHDFLAQHPRVVPIFRKTNTIKAGADAFTRARDIEAALDALPGLLEQLEAAERERDEWRDRTRNVTEWWQSTKEQYEGEKARADRNQHHLNVERDANAKTVKYLNEQLEAAHAEIDGLNERIELRAEEDSIYRVYDEEVERRQRAEKERDDERRRAVNAETRIIALQRGKL